MFGWKAACWGLRIFCQSAPSMVIMLLPKIGLSPSKYLV